MIITAEHKYTTSGNPIYSVHSRCGRKRINKSPSSQYGARTPDEAVAEYVKIQEISFSTIKFIGCLPSNEKIHIFLVE